jgi:hypothetical protein
MSRFVSSETVEHIAKLLCSLHRPIAINYAAKFGIGDLPVPKPDSAPAVGNEVQPQSPPKASVQAPRNSAGKDSGDKANAVCRACNSVNLSIQYGKFGYYFKCGNCDGNTPIKISCGVTGHKEKIRKDGLRFYRECADCKASQLYFENAAS